MNNVFEYRDKITSKKINEVLNPLNTKIQEMLDVYDVIKKNNNNLAFVQRFISNDIASLNAINMATGLSLSSTNGVLLPLYLPELSKNIEVMGGTFTLEREWKASVRTYKNGTFDIAPFSVKVNDVSLTGNEKTLFGALFSGKTWFVKEVTTDEVTVEISAHCAYTANEISILGIPSKTSQITLLEPSASYRYSNWFIIAPFNEGTIKFTTPSIEYNGKKYLVLNEILPRYSIPKPYGEMIIPITASSGNYLTNYNVFGDFSTNQIRSVINSSTDFLIDVDEEPSHIYDSNIDPFPLVGGSFELNDNIYLHIVILNSTDQIPHIGRASWAIT